MQRELFGRVERKVLAELRRQGLWRRVRRWYEPDDVVQEVWRRLEGSRVLEGFEWRGKGSLERLVGTVAERALEDMNRRMSADKRGSDVAHVPLGPGDPDGPPAVVPAARDKTPSFLAGVSESLRRAWSRLDPDEREVLGFMARGHDEAEISRRLKRSRRWVHKVVERIRHVFRPHEDD